MTTLVLDGPMTRPGVVGAVLGLLGRFVLGTLLVMTPVTAILVAGWGRRLMARGIARSWGRAGDAPGAGQGWPRFILDDHAGALLAAARAKGLFGGLPLVVRALFGSLAANFAHGLGVVLSAAAVTLPLTLLIAVAWWAGWENSFNKGYEQAYVGPLMSLCAVFGLTLVLAHLPLAEARAAAAGSARAFFDLRAVRRLFAMRRAGMILVALLFLAAGAGWAFLRVLPLGVGNQAPTAEAVEAFRGAYTLASAAFVFLAYTALRVIAARVYAGAAMSLYARGGPDAVLLSPAERAALDALAADRMGKRPPPRGIAGGLTWFGGRAAMTVAFVLSTAVWGGFVFLIYLAQFLNHDWVHWVVHPLVLLPWANGLR